MIIYVTDNPISVEIAGLPDYLGKRLNDVIYLWLVDWFVLPG